MDNRRLLHEMALLYIKVGVWCAVTATDITGCNFSRGTVQKRKMLILAPDLWISQAACSVHISHLIFNAHSSFTYTW